MQLKLPVQKIVEEESFGLISYPHLSPRSQKFMKLFKLLFTPTLNSYYVFTEYIYPYDVL